MSTHFTFYSYYKKEAVELAKPSCNGNHVFMVEHGYPWLFHAHGHAF